MEKETEEKIKVYREVGARALEPDFSAEMSGRIRSTIREQERKIKSYEEQALLFAGVEAKLQIKLSDV